jgi:MATE family multidrug resistance protein
MQSAACTIVGNCIGENNVPNALKNLKSLIVYFVMVMIVEAMLIYTLRYNLVEFFTEDSKIIKMSHDLFWTQVIWMLTDMWQASLAGIIRGIGKQQIFSLMCFIAYYPINFTFVYFLTFKVGFHNADYSEYGWGRLTHLQATGNTIYIKGLG